MFSLTIIFNLYLLFGKFIYLFKTLWWYIFIGKLLNTYWNSFLIILIFSLILTKKKNLLVIFFFYLALQFDCFYTINYFFIPKQLIIGYNNIHPVLFYYGSIFFICYFYNWNVGFYFKLLNIFLILCSALLLGGLWGSGNSIWGFFWVNDKIELILFFLCILLLWVVHTDLTRNLLLFVFFIFFLIILWIFSLRWGFSFTRHNFFNLKNLVNIFIVFFFLSLLCNMYSFFFLLLVFHNIYYLLYTLLIICIANCYLSFFSFKFINYNTHIFFFILIISWVKYKYNNLLFFFLKNKLTPISLILSLNCFGLINNIFFFKIKFFKLVFNVSCLNYYFPMKLYSFFNTFMSYYFVWSFIFLLIFFFFIFLKKY